MPIEMSKYLGIYITEATEHLEALGRELVELEKNKSDEVVDSMFRHAHSLKGMAAAMGYEATAVVAHRIEDLAQVVRADRSKLNPELVDLLLAGTDALSEQVRAAAENREAPAPQAILARLTAKFTALTQRAPPPTRMMEVAKPEAKAPAPIPAPTATQPIQAEAPSAPLSSNFQTRWSIRLSVAPTCQVPGVRAFLVYKRLSNAGRIFELRPPIESLRSGRIPDGLISLELQTEASESEIRALVKNIAEVELLSVEAVQSSPAPTPPKAETAPEGARTGAQEPIRTVRIRTELLDYLLENAGELMLAGANMREWGKGLPGQIRTQFNEGVDRLQLLVKDLHGKVMSSRMTPLSSVTDRLPRATRDLARRRGKEVDLVVTGADVELDRAIIDCVSDPLLHLLRNCVDHGIEEPKERETAKKGPRGRVLLGVRRTQDRVVIELEDDGRGMDAEKLKSLAKERGLITAELAARINDKEAFLLACLPGISTAKEVSDISGRGVGLDAVKRAVENLGGKFEIDSRRGRGTRFTLDLPLTVSVINLMLAKVSEEVVGLPIAKVLGATAVDSAKLSSSRDSAFLAHEGGLLPVYELASLLRWPAAPPGGIRPYIVSEGESGKVALAVDKLLGQEEVVLKVLPSPLHLIPGLSGVSILGSGRPIFILDVPRLLEHGLAGS
jgi:two-component system, chemotaxis family, sensor kinase CheA